MARKGWDLLTPNYRRRLEKAGLTPETYAAGAPLHKARGKVSVQHESSLKQQNKADRAYAREYAATYGLDFKDVAFELAHMKPGERRRWIQDQKAAERYYDRGETDKAGAVYRRRSRPDAHKPYIREGKPYTNWMFYYHGAFH